MKFLLDRPRAFQEYFFSAPEVSKSAPRGFQEASAGHGHQCYDLRAILSRFSPPRRDPATSTIAKLAETSYKNRGFALSLLERLRSSILDPLGLPLGSLLDPKMAETSLGNPLGAAKKRSRGLFFGPRAVQERSKRSQRPLQEASMRPRRSKKGPRGLWAPISTSLGPPWDLKNGNFGHDISVLV